MPSLEQVQEIPAPVRDVFAFFSDPANLARITPPWLRFRIHGEPPRALGAGCRIEYRIRWMVFRLRWVTRISRWDPPASFEDVQERGPYARWIHTHRFADLGGRVRMSDHVEYALPFGPMGRLVHRFLVRRQLEQIFDYRRRAIEEIFGLGTPPPRA